MKKWQTVLASISIIGLTIMFGCSAVMDAVTPCEIERGATEYTKQSPKKYLPYTSLLDSKRINAWLNYTNETNQASFRRLAEDDNRWYGFLRDRTMVHQQGAMAFQEIVFTPQGPIGLLIPSLFAGTLGALLIKRPGDKSKKEVETENNNKKSK